MAIDSSLFMVDLPAGTYSIGDTVELSIKAGPALVRSGRGAAILKRTTVGIIGDVSGSVTGWKVEIKNSDWIDPMISATASLWELTALDERTGTIQRGNDCPLTPNSSWKVIATCTGAATTTVANSIFAIIDVDYPSVAAIVDPDALPGIPTSIDYITPTINARALGTSSSATWNVVNVDIFKAGYEYAMQKLEMLNFAGAGFIAIANAAGMGGLCRIMPVSPKAAGIRNKIEYATKLVKGPMDIQFLMFANSGTASTSAADLLLDFVKRKV